MPRLAISKDFFPAYSLLPRKAQRKADDFLAKFQEQSKSASIHLEPIQRAIDSQLRSARIGDDYRMILRAPEQGDVFLVLWADHHDEAYRWAATKQTAIHPQTGSLQIFDPVLAGQVLVPTPAALREGLPKPPALFAERSDDELYQAGVPRPLLPSVRAICFEDELDLLLPHLPPEAAETLTGLAAGLSLDEALEEVLGRAPPQAHATEPPPPDPLDLPAALERETTQRQFLLLGEDLDLDAAIHHPLDVWRVFLHPKQKRIAYARTKGPVRVLGGAGTGKTVVAMHRAAFLVREVYKKPDDRILFTTFTKNLAADIRSQLEKLLGPDERARIDVVHLDKWARDYLQSRGRLVRAVDDRERESELRTAFEVYGEDGRSFDFYLAEWRDVLQEQGLESEDDYVRAVRRHRGVPLSRAERRRLWPVFRAYREQLASEQKLEFVDILRAARAEFAMSQEPLRYRSVVVDETQDFSLDALRLVRAIAGPEHPDDLFMVGDAHQRIYGRPVAMSQAGIQVRGRRSQTLRLNYRTTAAICRYATRALADQEVDDLDDGKADRRGYISVREGPAPIVRCLPTALAEEQAVVAVVRELKEADVPLESICIIARTTGPLEDHFAPALARAEIPYAFLTETEPRAPGVRLSTMHRAKGLEFGSVLLVDAGADALPQKSRELESEDTIVSQLALAKERSLLYVAASRARDDLYIFAHGALSPLLPAALAPSQVAPAVPARSSRPPVAAAQIAAPEDILATALASLPLPTRMINWANAHGVATMADLLARSPADLLAEKNLGRTSIKQTQDLVERLTGKPWALQAPSSTQGAPVSYDAAAKSGNWDLLRAALSDEQRAVPLAAIALPARLASFCERESLVTLGDLAGRSRATIEQADNLGRSSVKELPRIVVGHFQQSESDRMLFDEGLVASFRTLANALEGSARTIVVRRAGLGGAPQTLQELGDLLGVSRERIRQIEAKACDALAKRPWGQLARQAIEAELRAGARPLREVETSPLWADAADNVDLIRFICESVLEQKAIIELDDEHWLSPIEEGRIRALAREATERIATTALPCPLGDLERMVEATLAPLGPRLSAHAASELYADLVIDRADPGAPRVMAIGAHRQAELLTLLRASNRPLRKEEIEQRIGRVHTPEEVIYFDRGLLGLRQHFPDFDDWRARLVPRAEKIVRELAPERQWSCTEILDELREELEIPSWLTAWCLAALIKTGSALSYLGRLRVAIPGDPQNDDRIMVHEEVERLLTGAGEPMTRDEIESRVRQRLGVSEIALSQVFGRPQFVRLDGERIGLVDRDVEGGPPAIREALDHLEGIFSRRGRGLSHFEALRSVQELDPVYQGWTTDLVASLMRSDGRFRLSQSGAAGLATWESTRVPTRLELARSALVEGEGRVSVEALCDRVEAHYGERPGRNQLAALAMNAGASLAGEWMLQK